MRSLSSLYTVALVTLFAAVAPSAQFASLQALRGQLVEEATDVPTPGHYALPPDRELAIALVHDVQQLISARLAAFWDRLGQITNEDSVRALEAELSGATDVSPPEMLIERGLIGLRVYELSFDKGYHYRALKSLKQAALRFSDTAWAHYALGMAYARGPEVQIPNQIGYRHRVVHALSLAEGRAREELRRAVELDPTLADAALELAALGLASRFPATLREARAALLDIIRAEAAGAKVWVALSDVESAMGGLDAAEEAARSALAVMPGDAAALHTLAVALLAQEGREQAGADVFFAGVDRLTEAAAERYFEDALGVMKEREEAEWQTADLEGRREWLRTFWELRAAVAGVTVAERLGEHYRRLAIAHELYRRTGTRGTPPAGSMLIDERHRRLPFDDRGLILVRHGEPDDVIRTARAELPVNESWLYKEAYGLPRFFHFLKGEGRPDFALAGEFPPCRARSLGQSLAQGPRLHFELYKQLAPLIQYYEDRARYDSRFQIFAFRCGTAVQTEHRKALARLQGKNPEEVSGLDARDLSLSGASLAAEARLTARQALRRESYAPEFDSDLRFIYDFYALKGESGQTDLTAALLIPGEVLEPANVEGQVVYSFAVSFILADSLAGRVDRVDTVFRYRAPGPLAAGAYLRTHVVLSARPAGSAFYRLVVRNVAVSGQGQLYGGPTRVRGFSSQDLTLSDIVLAEGEGGTWRRGGVRLSLRPSHGFREGEPIALFYEIYNLPAGAPYRTELTIEPIGAHGAWSGLMRLLRLRRSPLGLSLRFQGEAGMPVGAGLQELRRVTAALLPGAYTLRVKITNLQSGESSTGETEFRFLE